MLHKAFAFETKEVDEANGTFTGYASVFGIKDLGGDVVEPGAFTRTLKESGGIFPLLVDHNPSYDAFVGSVVAEEDSNGLLVKGTFIEGVPKAQEVRKKVRFSLDTGLKVGMSFGYDIADGGSKYDKKTDTMHLLDLTMHEASITNWPMNPAAGISGVKAQLEQIERMSDEERRELIKALSAGLEPEGLMFDPTRWDYSGTVPARLEPMYEPTTLTFNLGAQDSEAIAMLETLTERVRASA